jgi:hypothetical protein
MQHDPVKESTEPDPEQETSPHHAIMAPRNTHRQPFCLL